MSAVSTGIGNLVSLWKASYTPPSKQQRISHMVLEYDGRMRRMGSRSQGRAIKSTHDLYARDIHDKHIWNQIADKISQFCRSTSLFSALKLYHRRRIGTYYNLRRSSAQASATLYGAHNLPLSPEIRQAVRPEEAVSMDVTIMHSTSSILERLRNNYPNSPSKRFCFTLVAH